MKAGKLPDLQVISLLIFVLAESSIYLLFWFVLVVAHQHQCWLTKVEKSSKTEGSAMICDCFIAAPLAPSNPMKYSWNQLSSVLLVRLHPGSVGEIVWNLFVFPCYYQQSHKGKNCDKVKVKEQKFLHNWTPVSSPSLWLFVRCAPVCLFLLYQGAQD